MHISRLLAPALLLGATQGALALPDFQGGVFIMNEEQSGNPGNGSINFFNQEGDSWVYRIFRQENPEKEINGAICHAHFFGGYLFVVSNHPVEPGSYNMTGTLTVLDANTLAYIHSIELVNSHGKAVQGRCALAMNDHGTSYGEINVLVTTTDGVLTYNLSRKTLSQEIAIATSPDGIASPEAFQYPYQTGSMVRMGETVVIATQSDGVVIYPLQYPDHIAAKSIEDMFPDGLPEGLSADNGIGSVVMSKDGNIWMSVTADKKASGEAAPVLIKYDTATGLFSAVNLPEGIYPPANSWYAWTPDGFHASATENVLYWNGGPGAWFANSRVFKYDIDADTFTCVLDLEAEAQDSGQANPWKIYGCSMRTSPVNGEMYLSLFQDYSLKAYTLRRLGSDGKKLADYPMQEDFWFPSLPVFPDLEGPTLKTFDEITIPTDKATRIDLAGAASDPDSPEAGIIYSVADVSHHDTADFSLRHDGRSVTICPSGTHTFPSDCWVDVRASSQGKTDIKRLRFKFSTAGVDDISAADILAKASVSGSELTLRNDNANILGACIFTPEGRIVMNIDAPAGESVHSLSDLPSGLYLLRFGACSLKFRL